MTENKKDCANPSPTGPGNGIPESEALALIALQQKLACLRHRGDMQQVRDWIGAGHLEARVFDNGEAVGLLVDSTEPRASSVLSADSDYLEAALQPYATASRLRVDDYLYLETQWPAAIATCFLVGPKVVMTAAHMFHGNEDAFRNERLKVVFDFQTKPDLMARHVFHRPTSVFTVKRVHHRGGGGFPDGDWVALELDREPADVANRPTLRLARTPPGAGRAVYTLGHPAGMSMRYVHAITSRVSEQSSNCYRAYLDAYMASSGSPVFDAQTHEVVGMIKSAYAMDEGIVRTRSGYLSLISSEEVGGPGTLYLGAHLFSQGYPPFA